MANSLGPVGERLRSKLQEAFAPVELDVLDQSESHRGHAGYRDGGETHFHVRIKAADFDGVNRVTRQRMVHKVLADDLQTHGGRVHALSMELSGNQE